MTTKLNRILAGGLALLLWPAASVAQSLDARWQGWIGCWASVPADVSDARSVASAMRVCIVPATGRSAVEIVTITDGKVRDRTLIRADAEPHALDRDGCQGSETAWWSVTGRQLYLRGSLTCADGTRRSSSGVLSLTRQNEWIDVRGLATNDSASGVAVGRFAAMEAADSARIPADVRHAVPVRRPLAAHDAVAAVPPLTLADIAEVSTVLEAGVASAWLVERTRGLTFAVDGKKLAALADNGVPASVIDVAVALAYPDVFGITSDAREAQRLPGAPGAATQVASRDACRGVPMNAFYYDPCLWRLDPWDYYGGYGRRYGYYGYPYGSLYGYYGYNGYGFPYGWYAPYGRTYYTGGATVVVIQNSGGSPGLPPSHGRVVKGQGYTSGPGWDGPAARPGGAFTPSTAGHGSISAGSGATSSASSGSTSSAASSGGGRTAVPKP